ncbi:MAG: cation transporter [Planctomycetes bacterium]|nr:cation transporter [Planctomycetota bacterium]
MISEQRARVRAGVVSLSVGLVLLGAKFVAYNWTGSSAVLSDALESIANVVAAAFLIGSVVFAGKPADKDHPYGHGKIEFFAAAFEGGLITFASIATMVASVLALWRGPTVREIDLGLFIVGSAAAANLILGIYLVRVGKRYNSIAIRSDGHHVLSDVWTTAAILIGLGLVKISKLEWIDPIVAMAMGLQLGWTGFRLVREAAGGLLDEADETTITKLLETLERDRPAALIRLHHLRALRFGARTHVDAHLVVPEFWTVDRAHALCDALEHRLTLAFGESVDVVFHADPCRRDHCKACDVLDCNIRKEGFVERPPLTLEEAQLPDPIPA